MRKFLVLSALALGMTLGIVAESEAGISVGLMRQIIQHEIGLRNRLKRQVEHAKRQDAEITVYKTVLREFFTEQQMQQFWDKVNELRKAPAP